MNPDNKRFPTKSTIIFKEIALDLPPSFMNTDTGTQYKKRQQHNISKHMAMGNDMGNRGHRGHRQGRGIQ